MFKFIRILFSRSALFEVVFRNIYWRFNIGKLINVKESNHDNEFTDFDKVLNKLKNIGVTNGSILIIHSSYYSLKNCSIKPSEMIDKILNLLGENGTLVMNSARFLKKKQIQNLSYLTYDLKKSRVWTGVLPHFMLKHKQVEISEFPFNPIVAIGRDAKKIISKNINSNEINSSCGPNSGWKYCVDNNAIVVGLGISLGDNLTIMHVAEENHYNWPVKNWYKKLNVEITNNIETKKIIIKNRRSKWGKLYYSEKKFERDLMQNKILHKHKIDGLKFEHLNSNKLIKFMNTKNKNSPYPYLIPSFFLK